MVGAGVPFPRQTTPTHSNLREPDHSSPHHRHSRTLIVTHELFGEKLSRSHPPPITARFLSIPSHPQHLGLYYGDRSARPTPAPWPGRKINSTSPTAFAGQSCGSDPGLRVWVSPFRDPNLTYPAPTPGTRRI
ncbi:hypothetical protein PGT21_009177 [Puccinia graminis f. sp. tritici]|uniref:Uncharacterized protein n=1 Tax=Puccinia graminis f. sp. tritici TaxID=56615 RepID=A0A5B0PK54_PUCGR|nr:hypothetical protein PGT21_009177 [Puccinia graminis f. sp. tritici]